MHVGIGLRGIRKSKAVADFVGALVRAGVGIDLVREDGHGEAVVRFTWAHGRQDQEAAATVVAFAAEEARKVGAGVYTIIIVTEEKTWHWDGYGEVVEL